jgi:glycosyltransferase involved in cell wall biosynthesis
MRIMMFSHGYPPTISGVTIVVRKVARAMVRRGHDVTVVTASDRGRPYEYEDKGVRLVRVRSAPNPFWAEGPLPIISYRRLKKIVDRLQPEIINTHDGALLSWQLHRLEQEKTHVPELLTCHFLPRFITYYVRAGDLVEKMIENITWDVTLRMINGFDHVVFPTTTQQGMFNQEGLRAPSSVISNGLDAGRYKPTVEDGEDVSQRYALPDGPRILFVGRLAVDKRVDVLINALTSLDSAHLILAGRGIDRERLERLSAQLDLADRVHFLGFVSEADLPGLYRAVNLFSLAAEVEVQSIPTMQAAATGLPIVAANAGALPELVDDGVNGYLVPPDDPVAFAAAWSRILGSPDQATAFGRASLEVGSRHAEERTFDEYERLYQLYADKAV